MKLFGHLSVYGLLIAAAVALGVFYCTRQEKRLGMPKDTGVDFALWVMPAALIGARLYYVAFQWGYYSQNPLKILYVWEGGLAIYGGVLGGALGAFFMTRRKKISFALLADMVAPALILGQAIGRWGNFFNGECYGLPITDPRWQFFPAAVFVGGAWHMATFFYESAWDLLGFLVLHFTRKKTPAPGCVFLRYLVWYGLGRAVIEGLRTDSLMWGNIRVSQALSVLMALSGAAALLILHLRAGKKRGAAPS